MLSNGHAGAAKLWPTGFICSLLIIFYSLFFALVIEKNYEGVESNKINSSTSSSMTHMTFCLHSIPFLQGGLVSHLWRSYCPPPSPPFPSSLFFLPSPYHLSSLKIFVIIFSLFCVCVLCGHMRGSQKTTLLSHMDPGDQTQVIRTGATVTHQVTLLACPSFWDWVLCRLA